MTEKEIPSILFISENYPPENFAAAIRVFERGEYWKKWGYFTQYITTFPNRHLGKNHDGYENKLFRMVREKNKNVLRVKTFIPKRNRILFRAIHQISFMFSSFIGGLFLKKNSVVIATTPQFFCSFSALLISKIKRIPFILEVADIWTNSIKATIKTNSIFFSFLLKIEEYIFKKSDAIIVLTEGFKKELINRGISEDKIFIIQNGVNKPILSRHHKIDLRKELNLTDEIIIGYAGSLGLAQGIENICNTAEILESRKNKKIKFVFIGNGDNKDLLIDKSKLFKNLIYLGNKDRKIIPNYLTEFDIGLAHLINDEAFKTTIPSKIFEFMASGLPILMVSPKGDASEIIEKFDIGKWVNAGDAILLANTIEEIVSNLEKLKYFSQNSIKASLNFSRENQAKKVIEVVEKVISSKIKK